MNCDAKENHGHVHFSEDTDEVGHTHINIKTKGKNNYEAHVGFLQIHHRYKIIVRLPIPSSKGEFELNNNKVQSVYTKLTHIGFKEKNSEELEIILEFLAYKEKLLKENVYLIGPNKEEVVVTIFARVLGKGKGTPMLREEVTCIEVLHTEDESEASDWQGFD